MIYDSLSITNRRPQNIYCARNHFMIIKKVESTQLLEKKICNINPEDICMENNPEYKVLEIMMKGEKTYKIKMHNTFLRVK